MFSIMLGCMHFFKTLHLRYTSSKKCLQPLLYKLYYYYLGNLVSEEIGTDLPALPAPAAQPPCKRMCSEAAGIYAVGWVGRVC